MHDFASDAGREGGELVYRHLTKVITDSAKELAVNPPTNESDFLTFLFRRRAYFHEKARLAHNALNYFNRHWIRRERNEGNPNIVDIMTLHRNLLCEQFLSPLEDHVRTTTFRFYINGGSLNLSQGLCVSSHEIQRFRRHIDQLEEDDIQMVKDVLLPRVQADTYITLPDSLSRRQIWLLGKPLVRSTWFRGLIQAMRHSRLMTWTTPFDHWALWICPAEVKLDAQQSYVLPFANIREAAGNSGFICELCKDEGRTDYSYSSIKDKGTEIDQYSVYGSVGFTSQSDESIKEFGELPKL